MLPLGLGYSEIVDYISRLNQRLNEDYGREAI